MVRLGLWIVGAAAVAIAAVALADSGSGATSRVVDRTFACNLVSISGSARELEPVAYPRGAREVRGTSSTSSGYISARTGAGLALSSDLVFARARSQPRFQNQPFPPGVYANSRRCSAARTTIPLSSKGLPGPPTRFQTERDCVVRGRALVRVRAVLSSPARWRRYDAPYVGARRNVVSAKLAVRAQTSGKPVAYLELDAKGRTRLWYSADCS